MPAQWCSVGDERTDRLIDEGTGPPLLVFHGWNGSKHNVLRWLPALAPRFRVIVPDLPGCNGHAPLAEFAAGHFAIIGADEQHAVFFQNRAVAFYGCAFPHPHIHRRSHQDRLVGGEQCGGSEIARQAVRHFGHQVGGGRRHHHQIGAARQLDMPHLGFIGEAEKIAIDFFAGQRRQ